MVLAQAQAQAQAPVMGMLVAAVDAVAALDGC
jgi:hypothetical protein